MTPQSLDLPVTRFLEYWRLVVKYKWQILLGTLALSVAFTAIIAELPNVYEATTTILVDPQQVSEKYVSAAVSMDPYARLNTITQQVLSRTRLQEIVDKFDLYSERRGVASPEEVVEQMREDITIQVKQGSGPELSTFAITFQGKQPSLVAKVADELATSFIQWNVNSREQQVTGTKDFVSSELAEAKKSLEQQENRLRQFKMSHLGETPDQTVNNLQALTSLRSALQSNEDAMNRRDAERILLTRLPEPIIPGANADTSLTERGRLQLEKRQLEAKLQQMREHYGVAYPDVVKATRRLEDVDAKLTSLPPDSSDHIVDSSSRGNREESSTSVRLELLDNEMKRLTAEQNRIQSQIAAYEAKVEAAPLREQQLVELTRNYEVSKLHYQALLDKSFNIDMAADLEQKQKGERFRVLDPAHVPEKPIKPRRKKLIALSCLVAPGLMIFLVLGKEALNQSIKTEMELKSLLPANVRLMGLIPRIETVNDQRRGRRFAVLSALVCLLLCLAEVGIIWNLRPVL